MIMITSSTLVLSVQINTSSALGKGRFRSCIYIPSKIGKTSTAKNIKK